MTDISAITDHELQLLRLAYSVVDLTTLLQLGTTADTYKILRERKIKSPPDFVRDLDPELLAYEIAASSHKEVADRYKVSVSFLKSLFKGGPAYTQDELAEMVKTFGSKTVVSRMTGVKKSQIPDLEGEPMLRLGNFTSGIGRRCELYVLGLIGGRDMNLDDSRYPFDILHNTYGKINVKGTQKRPWRVPKAENCDYVAFIHLGPNASESAITVLVPAEHTPCNFKKPDDLPDETIFLEENLGLLL